MTDSPFALDRYDTVGGFLENEATGQTKATFMSGSGFAAETYEEQAYETASDYFHRYLTSTFPLFLTEDGGIDDWVIDALFDAAATDDSIIEQFFAMPLTSIYARYSTDAIAMRQAK